MESNNVKLVVFAPVSHATVVRDALGHSGAGKIGNYEFCSFSSKGTGRFCGNKESNPAIGKAGEYESVEEERIEVLVSKTILTVVIAKMKEVHPYEEVAYDIYPLLDLTKKFWFKNKRYGYGWVPATWQGWTALAVYAFLLAYFFARADVRSHSGSDTLIGFAVPFVITSSIFLTLCYRKGEKPKWQWGNKKRG